MHKSMWNRYGRWLGPVWAGKLSRSNRIDTVAFDESRKRSLKCVICIIHHHIMCPITRRPLRSVWLWVSFSYVGYHFSVLILWRHSASKFETFIHSHACDWNWWLIFFLWTFSFQANNFSCVFSFHSRHRTCIGGQTFKILSWLGYSNSAFNPIIYSIFNTEFREAFKRILTTKNSWCCSQDLGNVHPRNSDRYVTDYAAKNVIHSRSSADIEQVSAIWPHNDING